jgi:hypothetical protein
MNNFAHTLIVLVRRTRAVRLSTNPVSAHDSAFPASAFDGARPDFSLCARPRTRICVAYQ